MWNSGKKICALRDNNKYILTLVLSEKKILNETKNHNPPPPSKLNGLSLTNDHSKPLIWLLANNALASEWTYLTGYG